MGLASNSLYRAILFKELAGGKHFMWLSSAQLRGSNLGDFFRFELGRVGCKWAMPHKGNNPQSKLSGLVVTVDITIK